MYDLNRCRVSALLHKHSTSLKIGKNKDMAEKANILITEIFDSELLGEEVLKTINHAKEHLLEVNSFLYSLFSIFSQPGCFIRCGADGVC